jgi:predicted Zn-dependent peptidase
MLGWDFPEEVALTEDLPPAEIVILGFALPEPSSPESWPIAVMQQLLGGGAVDPFEESLVTRRKKAVYASTEWMETRRGAALMFTGAFLPYRSKAKAFRLMDETVEELARMAWLTEASLASAKRTIIRRELNAVYYPDERAGEIGTALWWRGDARLAFEGPARIEAVTREDVERVFREYIAGARPVRVYMQPNHVPLLVRMFGWLYPLFQG